MARHIFKCIDGHTCGNPVRLVISGQPKLNGNSMSELRKHFVKEFDWIRKSLMFEPRGHDLMSGSILYPPFDSRNDAGILFIETSGCLPMCGHGTIGTVTLAMQEKLIRPNIPGKLRLETPAGLVKVSYGLKEEKVDWVKLWNVPSYLAATNISLECPDLGRLDVQVAYGGNFYAIIDVQDNFPGLEYFKASDLIRWSPVIRERIKQDFEFVHPIDRSIKGLSHVLWTGSPLDANSTSRCAVFYGEKAIDRSPCGTGTSARMAQWVNTGKLKVGDTFIHESIIGSKFVGKVEKVTKLENLSAIVPSIQGWAKITGYNEIIVDDEDPFVHGFQVL